VFAIVPLVEFGAPRGRDPVPDRHHCLTRETHCSIHFGLRFCRKALTPSLPSACRRHSANASADCSSNSSRGILRLSRISRLVTAFACGEQRVIPASTC